MKDEIRITNGAGDEVSLSPNRNRHKQIIEAIRHQDEVAKSTVEKIDHQVREMKAKVLEEANVIIARQVPFGVMDRDAENNIGMAYNRIADLERLKNLLQ